MLVTILVFLNISNLINLLHIIILYNIDYKLLINLITYITSRKIRVE